MNLEWLLGSVSAIAISVIVTRIIVNHKANKSIEEYKTLREAISVSSEKLKGLDDNISDANEKFATLDKDTKELQELKKNSDELNETLRLATVSLDELNIVIKDAEEKKAESSSSLSSIMSKIDLYSRIDAFVDEGLFEEPDYLFETSLRYAEEIKNIRNQQKYLIGKKKAIIIPDDIMLWSVKVGVAPKIHIKKIIAGQVKLMLTAFNIDCDFIIGKVSPSNLPRTLERIEKLAASIEQNSVDWNCGFNTDYVELKFKECKLQFEYKLKKKEEKEEQALIREQIRQEQQAIKEYEKALSEAEKEEKLYTKLLAKAREELAEVSLEERTNAELRIKELEEKLFEAEEREKRAKSMAEMTRRGHVYVISNIGSFGEGIYKIGMTRRLDPLDRVKELGDASVPFRFDVHAIIYSEDAPSLETSLHRKFKQVRVNAVNFRKEFFRTEILEIKEAVEEITGGEASFKLTIAAEEYFETLRLQGVNIKNNSNEIQAH